jgi:3-(3-hydroxy-phenyl)propionate hydroxylase/6-hydroxy-3-succinoylpyridine 3-monooxygenase
MHQRSAPTYRVGRALLAGDAAHITNPVGGLGLTMGLFDSFALVEALGAVIGGEAEDSLLDRYSAERLEIFWTITSPQATENKRFIYHSNDPVRLERELGVARRLGYDKHYLLQRLLFTQRLRSPRK